MLHQYETRRYFKSPDRPAARTFVVIVGALLLCAIVYFFTGRGIVHAASRPSKTKNEAMIVFDSNSNTFIKSGDDLLTEDNLETSRFIARYQKLKKEITEEQAAKPQDPKARAMLKKQLNQHVDQLDQLMAGVVENMNAIDRGHRANNRENDAPPPQFHLDKVTYSPQVRALTAQVEANLKANKPNPAHSQASK